MCIASKNKIVVKKILILLALPIIYSSSMNAQNYEESKIPQYSVPKLLLSEVGQKITSADTWEEGRRNEVLGLFNDQMYGKVPEFEYTKDYQHRILKNDALNGKATQEEVTITIANEKGEIKIIMLLTLPNTTQGPVPIFLGLNFYGNQATSHNKEVTLTDNYVLNNKDLGIADHHAGENSRGGRLSNWPFEMILAKGYGLATVHCGDIDPDFDDGFNNGVHALIDTPPEANEWGTIAAWAWGLSRAMDYLETDERIDNHRVAVIGHSRLGKTSLWAGAIDERFALVISNNSGCGGAALSRRRIGETVEVINSSFPHWFCKNFHQYNGKEDDLPLDQHMLIALIAPRPVYVASAQEDQWADPKGEYTSLFLAGPVYKLYGFQTMQTEQPPPVDSPLFRGKLGYHIRTGAHALTEYDWEQYLKFADKCLDRD